MSTVPLKNSPYRRKSDPTPKDICKAFAELAFEAGFVHTSGGPIRTGTLNRKELAKHLGQARQTVSVWTNDIPPNIIDLPWIERKLGLHRGDILKRAGFVEDTETL